jgi:hypothetical protein
VPEPRRQRGRDFTAPALLQFDRTDVHQNDYQAQRRERAAAEADAYPKRRRRTRTSDGYAVQVRNGLPFRPYVYRGTGVDQMENADA